MTDAERLVLCIALGALIIWNMLLHVMVTALQNNAARLATKVAGLQQLLEWTWRAPKEDAHG